MPVGEDLQLLPGNHSNAAFGDSGLAQVGAWVSAEKGGFLENDYAGYFQLPLQRRRDVSWPKEFRYLFTHGSLAEAQATVGSQARLLGSSGQFHLFEAPRTSVELSGMILVRFSQGWGSLHQNQSADAHPLSVAGVPYAHGLGTQARSMIQFHITPGRHRR